MAPVFCASCGQPAFLSVAWGMCLWSCRDIGCELAWQVFMMAPADPFFAEFWQAQREAMDRRREEAHDEFVRRYRLEVGRIDLGHRGGWLGEHRPGGRRFWQ